MKNKRIITFTFFMVLMFTAPSMAFAAEDNSERDAIEMKLQQLIVEIQEVAVNNFLHARNTPKHQLKALEDRVYTLIDEMESVQEVLTKEEKDSTSDKIVQCLEALEMSQS